MKDNKDFLRGFAKVADVLFNGRSADSVSVPHKETIQELARRGSSEVRIGKTTYRIECRVVR